MPVDLTQPVTLLVNRLARRGASVFSQLEDGLRRRGFREVRSVQIDAPTQISELARQAAEGGGLVVIGGGDGSVALAAAGLAYTSATLGIIPLGTGNTLARSLTIPLDLNWALDVLVSGREATIDLTQANGRIFASALTIGLSALVAKQLSNEVKRRLGLLTYATLVPRTLLGARPFSAQITTPSQQITLRTYQFIAVNGRQIAAYLPASPETSLCDGLLTGFCLGEVSRWQLLEMTLFLGLGHLREHPESHYFSSPRVAIATDPVQDVDVDGDVCLRTPVDVVVLPGALKVVVPASLQSL